MFLFLIGLEMQPSRLWSLRREIFGLGVAQVGVCGALLTGVGMLFGLPPLVAFVAGMGFVLSSTAVVMQMLDERGETSTPEGQRFVSILLLEDLAIVPLLALVAVLAPGGAEVGIGERLADIAIALGAVAALVAAGHWLLNPLFRMLAAARAREVMTAAALLVVLGAALVMQVGGLSMAMGAFLAGVLLSESTFRHQLEADIEPFRGILLGLFFLGVGMSLDLGAGRRATGRIDPRRRRRLHGGERRSASTSSRGSSAPATARRSTAPRSSRRAASSPSCSMPRRPRPASSTPRIERRADGGRHPLHGADAARRDRRAPPHARRRAIARRRRRRRRAAAAACSSSASAASRRW